MRNNYDLEYTIEIQFADSAYILSTNKLCHDNSTDSSIMLCKIMGERGMKQTHAYDSLDTMTNSHTHLTTQLTFSNRRK